MSKPYARNYSGHLNERWSVPGGRQYRRNAANFVTSERAVMITIQSKVREVKLKCLQQNESLASIDTTDDCEYSVSSSKKERNKLFLVKVMIRRT